MMSVIKMLSERLVYRFRWRTALIRCGIDPTSTRLVSVRRRPDGLAMTLVVRSLTPSAFDLLSEHGAARLSWAFGRRVVVLGSDPYRPTEHLLLIETAPLAAGDLPIPEAYWRGSERSVPLGLHGMSGQPFDLTLYRPERGFTSLLIAGTTGAGKSNTVNVVMSGLIASRVCVVGLDCKGGETLSPWASLLGAPLADPFEDVAAAEELLSRLVRLMERRHRYPGPNYLPVALVIEEWASLPTKPASLGDAIDRIAAQGRSAGLGLVVTTQRPTSNVGAVRTSTRGNLPIKIAHSTVGDRAASESVLGAGEGDAADLPTDPPGFALVRVGGGVIEPVRVFRCPGPLWIEPPLIYSLDDVEWWDAASQREIWLASEAGQARFRS
jgi:hypothetical protein